MRVFLVRHGEAEPGDRMPDHVRGLTGEGRAQARALGSWLVGRLERPVVMRCSSATRALQTAEEILREVAAAESAFGEDELYLASASDLLEILRAAAREGGSPILVGHNPGMAELSLGLAAGGEAQAMRRLSSRFPPAACAEIALPDHAAGGVVTRGGTLVDFFTPGAG